MKPGEDFAIRGDRLARRLAEVGMSQAQLARNIGVTQPSIAALISGKSKKTRHLHRIARELQTTPEYLTGERDEAGRGGALVSENRRDFRGGPAAARPRANDDDVVQVREIDLSLGAGGTYIGDGHVVETFRDFPRSWLRELTRTDPEFLVFARVKGNSMKPTLYDADVVIIDLTKTRISEQDEVWAVAVAEIGMVKRIWANTDGSYKIKSDNPNVDPETAVDGEMFVVGQVVGKLGKL